MNNSYNYSSFIGFSSATRDEFETYEQESQLPQLTDSVTTRRDETIDGFLFSSVLTEIYSTD